MRGPVYTFAIEARDTHGKQRDYNNLGTESGLSGRGQKPYPDFVVVVIKRVPWKHLAKDDQDLQPPMKWNSNAFPAKPEPSVNPDIRKYEGQRQGLLAARKRRSCVSRMPTMHH